MNELLLGIDIGTASTKAVLVEPGGTIVARGTRPHSLSLPRPGWAEHDAEHVWWTDVVSVSRELLDGRGDDVAAVGVSGIGPCVVPCDAQDRPLRPAILYGIDTRAEAEVLELTELLGADEIFARCGSMLSSQALGPKLLWLRRHEPHVWAATRRWHMASSFVVARLTGDWALDHHSASQCDPLYDLAASAWHAPWADQILGDLPLPRLAWPSEVVGEVSARAAEETGIPAGTPVVAGTVDAWAEALSAAVREPGDLMLMYGSTMFLVAVVEERGRHPALWTTRGIDPGSLTLAAGMATSGSLTAWLRELVGSPSFDDLVAEAAAVAPGADGLLLLPYFAGERTPIMDPAARGTITGLTLRHRRGHLYRAALEGIAYGLRQNLEAMGGGRELRAVAVGGGAAGGLWPQVVSDVTGVTQELPAETAGASYGDALLAAEGVGLVPAGTTWARRAGVVTPDPALRGLYDELYDLYRDLYRDTVEIQHALARRQLASFVEP